MPRFEAERLQDLDEVFRWYERQLLLLNEVDTQLPQLLSEDFVPDIYFEHLSKHKTKACIFRFRKIGTGARRI